ncbi:MAG: HepT-like ribonuclease domain-containing protein [Candidatus Caenarcaniphilales bacterium]|nr:HepT-like ribonuclease domain-containing protein [Candidatus Caenarcaniphilales bacterium]
MRIQNPKVPWTKIIGMRNILVHRYANTDIEIIEDVVLNELDKLKAEIEAIVSNLN